MGGVAGILPQRSAAGRQGPVSLEMLQSWLSKLGAGAHIDSGGGSPTTTAHATNTYVTYAKAVNDSHGFWSASDPTKLTVPKGLGGVYIISGVVRWEGHASGYRINRIAPTSISGVGDANSKLTLWDTGTTTDRLFPVPTLRLYMDEGDYIRCQVYQNSGGALDVEASHTTHLMMTRVGDLPVDARRI